MIISLISSKGGVGKTTIAVALADAATRAGRRVVIIDADKNQPVANWGASQTRVTVAACLDSNALLDQIDDAQSRFDDVIIDLEGTANMAMTHAIAASDLSIIPLSPSALDTDEAVKAIKWIRASAKAMRRDMPHAALFNRISPAIRTKHAGTIEAEMTASGVPIFETRVIEREALRAMFFTPSGLDEIATDSGRKSANNIDALWAEIVTKYQNQGIAA